MNIIQAASLFHKQGPTPKGHSMHAYNTTCSKLSLLATFTHPIKFTKLIESIVVAILELDDNVTWKYVFMAIIGSSLT